MAEGNSKKSSTPNKKSEKSQRKSSEREVNEELETEYFLESGDESDEDKATKTNNLKSYVSVKGNAYNLAQAKINALKMLEDRGYQLDDIDINITKMEPDELSKKLRYLEINKTYQHKTEDKILHLEFIFSGDNATLNKPIIQKLLAPLNKKNIKALVIIGDAPLGAKAIEKLLERNGIASSWFIQFFRLDELLYRAIDHGWCPKYGISLGNLPLMRYADLSDLKAEKDKDKFFIDPVCKYYGFRPDDVVKEIGVNTALNFLCPVYLLYRRVAR
jgi:hypothetical protein